MPGLDKTGPNGQGTGTGRRMGPCFSQNSQGNGRPGCGMGRRAMGNGRGAGRGMRSGQNIENVQSQPALEQSANGSPDDYNDNALEDRMSAIENKLDRLIESLEAKSSPARPAEK